MGNGPHGPHAKLIQELITTLYISAPKRESGPIQPTIFSYRSSQPNMADRGQDHVYDADDEEANDEEANDEDPANLIANLQLQDAKKSTSGKGRGRSGEFYDDSQATQQQQANPRYMDMRTAQGFENAV